MLILDAALIEKIMHDAAQPDLNDSFVQDVRRASAAAGMGIEVPDVAESLSLDMPIEQAHLIARAGELHMTWEEEDYHEERRTVA